MKFSEFGLNDQILSALADMGFEEATEIQQQALPFLLENRRRDFIGLAGTGTGKTAAFGLPLVQFADASSRQPEALILSPTRELCLQIAGELERFSSRRPGVKVTAVYGGASIGEQISELRRGSQIVVATPGRLADLIRRGKIDLSALDQLVLDEADIMLNMGFKEELDAILESVPPGRRTVLLSATMPPEVARIAASYMSDPFEVRIGSEDGNKGLIEHLYVMTHSRDKYQALKRLLDFSPDIYGIVFCRTKLAAARIADQLAGDGYDSAPIHGDLSQAQRDQVMASFRQKAVRILVATDVAARGIDVESVSHVIHYDLPDEAENYVHRSGRTGRAGRSGVSIALINMKENGRLRAIGKLLDEPLVKIPVPTGEEICNRQLLHLIDRVHEVKVDEERIAGHMAVIEEKLAAFDREELLKHFVSLEFNRFLSYYRDAPDINPTERTERPVRSSRNDQGEKRGDDEFALIRINLGKKDRINPGQIIALINESTRMRDIAIGRITIEEKSSLIMIESSYAELVKSRINSFHFRGRPVVATPEGKPGGRKHSGERSPVNPRDRKYRRGSGAARGGKSGGGSKGSRGRK
jgi:ATP-dependent RNA helicase DeaD